jgi:hypothetical protein
LIGLATAELRTCQPPAQKKADLDSGKRAAIVKGKKSAEAAG